MPENPQTAPPTDDFPVFPFEPDAIKSSKFRVIEPADMQSRQDVDALMRLMWQERECAFFYYYPKNGTVGAAIAEARSRGELLMDEMKRRFYRHPRFERDYLHIPEPKESYRWDWQKQVVAQGPEYWQVRLQLSARKIAEFDAMYKIQLEETHRRKERPANRLAKTVQPIHFEDFDGHQFERLVFAYHLRTENWRTLEWYGQTGGDLGRDIWGERMSGESLCIQCVNRKTTAAKKITQDLDKIVQARGGAPDAVLAVCASNVSASLRDKVKAHAQKKGIVRCDIWSGHEFEERLRRDAENLLRRFTEGETFPDDPQDLRRFTDSKTLGDDAVIERIIQVFDRPVFHTPFHQESSLPAFRQAIGDTIQAMNTGVWQTRNGKEIERLPSRHQLANETLRDELAILVRDLTELRGQFEQLIRNGEIRPCGCGNPDCSVFYFSPTAAQRMDALRAAINSRVHALRRYQSRSVRTPTQAVNVIATNNSGIIANQVTIRSARPSRQVIILPGSIASDPQKYNYVEYLIKQLSKFRDAGGSYGQRRSGPVHPGSTRKNLEKQLGGLPKDLPVARFAEVVTHLKNKIDQTALGRNNRKRDVRNYHSFEQHTTSAPQKTQL